MSSTSCSSVSFVDPHESLESVLKRSPSANLMTPEKANVPILPLKRSRSDDVDNKENDAPVEEGVEDEEQEDVVEDNAPMGNLDPRKLDIEAKVLFGDEGEQADKSDDEEGEEPSCTQPYPAEDA